MSTATHTAIFMLKAGHHYTSEMPGEEAFANAAKEDVEWAMLIELSSGKVVQVHGTAVTSNVDILGVAAQAVSDAGTPLVSAQTGMEPVSVNWAIFDASFLALSMDSAGKIRGWTQLPDNQDTNGNYFSTAIRATDIGASYGIELSPETMNAIVPALALTVGTIPHRQSLLTREAGVAAMVAAQEAIVDPNAATTLEGAAEYDQGHSQGMDSEYPTAPSIPAPTPAPAPSEPNDYTFTG